MAQDINVKYTDKNFNNLREQLIELSKNYFPDSYNDFSPTSPGMMFMEMAAYVGDILSFYQDSQLQETYLQYAQDPSNLYTLAYMLGYRPRISAAATVEMEVTQRVQASGSNYVPDFKQALKIDPEVQLETGNQKFYIKEGINFALSSSASPTDVNIFAISGDYPSEYILTKRVQAQSGEIVTKTITVGALQKYYTFEIDDSNLLSIIDIKDSSNNTWYEVPYLGQETVFTETGPTTNQEAPYTLSTTTVPRRFVTRFTSKGVLQVQFGPGSSPHGDANIVPEFNKIGSPVSSGINRLDYAYDPSNFLYTSTYGISPSNTTLTVRYLRGGGVVSNVEANTVTTTTNVVATGQPDNTYAGTLAFTNPLPATGGKDGDTVDELRNNTLRAFNEQGRVVTKEDFGFRALTMDPKFGVIAKTFVTTKEAVEPANYNFAQPFDVCLYVLSYNAEKKLVLATSHIKTNLKQYLKKYIMLTDAAEIKDAFVINIGVKYDIIALPNYNSREVLYNCTESLKTFFNTDKWQINQPINLSLVYTLLDRVKGVQTVKNLKVTSKVGGNYSEYDYDIEGATKDNIIYPSLDPMIFEIKYPNQDIEGRITTL